MLFLLVVSARESFNIQLYDLFATVGIELPDIKYSCVVGLLNFFNKPK